MTTPARVSVALALIGAIALCIIGFNTALEGVGPFKALYTVRIGLVVGVLPAYFVVLWLAAWSTYRAKRLGQGAWRTAALTASAVAAAAGAFFAPILPAASLAAACLSQALCPDIANPVLWSYLQLVTSLPVLQLAIGPAVVLGAAMAPIGPAAANEA